MILLTRRKKLSFLQIFFYFHFISLRSPVSTAALCFVHTYCAGACDGDRINFPALLWFLFFFRTRFHLKIYTKELKFCSPQKVLLLWLCFFFLFIFCVYIVLSWWVVWFGKFLFYFFLQRCSSISSIKIMIRRFRDTVCLSPCHSR